MENINLDRFDINEYFNKLRISLCKLGYKNKVININVAINLYQTYGKGFSEETFAKEVLCVSAEQYKKAKAIDGNIKILKTKNTISDEEINNLRIKLIESGHTMNKINYEQFSELYIKYGTGLTERTFAIKVLDLNYGNYRRLKEIKDAIVIILKNVGNVQEIKNMMLEDGYENYILKNYSDFLDLYYKYGLTFTEVFFSENVLNVIYDNYIRLKKGNFEVKIFSTVITQNDIDKIKNILEQNGYKHKSIDYTEFLTLYQEYGNNMSKKEFAMKVLNLSIDMYKNIKVKNGKSVILKENVYNENIESIKQELIKQKLINKSIDYSEFLTLYQEYGSNMSEKEFATDVLDLSVDSYRALRRCNNKDKFKILKKEIPKELERIKKILISKGYSNKKIYYDELHELYSVYGSFISERQFAMQALELSSSSYQDIKYKSKKNIKLGAIMLPYKKLTAEELEKIRQELIASGFENKKVSICEIDELYQKYSDSMSKIVFLEDVLGVYNVSSLSKDSNITILKKKDVLDNSTIEQIKQMLYKEGFYYKKIKPKDTYELYEKYGNGLTYNTFIYQILGITRKQVDDAETHNSFVRIIDKNVKNTMELVMNTHLQEVRYYSQEEILNICERYNINLKDFILYSLIKTVAHNHDTYIDTYSNILNDHNQLWIGNSKISNDIILKYYYEIKDKIYRIISAIRAMYPMAYEYSEDKFDDFQDLLLFFIESGSEVEKNFMVYEDPNWGRYLYGKLKRRMMIRAFSRIGVAKAENKTYWQDEDGDHEKELIDKAFDTEEIEISNIHKNDELSDINNCVLLFGQLLADGNNINEAKKNICDKFDISELEFGNYMKIYMEKHNNIRFDLAILNIDDEYNVPPANVKKLKL